jgi:tRNA dimethylallyltransferase
LVKIPNIPHKFRIKIRLIHKKEGQKKFYKRLLKLDKKIQNKFDPNDTQRSIRAFEIKSYTKISMYDWLNKTKPTFNDNEFFKIYIDFNRQKLIKKISIRTVKMLQTGAIDEVRRFYSKKIKKEASVNKVIGVNELKKYLRRQMTLEEVRELISIRTRQYAKRQATWARSRMLSWNKISSNEIPSLIKKINKSLLNLTN